MDSTTLQLAHISDVLNFWLDKIQKHKDNPQVVQECVTNLRGFANAFPNTDTLVALAQRSPDLFSRPIPEKQVTAVQPVGTDTLRVYDRKLDQYVHVTRDKYDEWLATQQPIPKTAPAEEPEKREGPAVPPPSRPHAVYGSPFLRTPRANIAMPDTEVERLAKEVADDQLRAVAP